MGFPLSRRICSSLPQATITFVISTFTPEKKKMSRYTPGHQDVYQNLVHFLFSFLSFFFFFFGGGGGRLDFCPGFFRRQLSQAFSFEGPAVCLSVRRSVCPEMSLKSKINNDRKDDDEVVAPELG